MNAQSTRATRRVPAWLAYPALGAGLAALAACSATQKAQVAHASAFLGADAVDARGVCYHASADVAHLVGAMAAAYLPFIPLPARFFPVSAIAGVAGALVPIAGGWR